MKRKINNLNLEISNEKRTYNFMFGNCETEKEKNKPHKEFFETVIWSLTPALSELYCLGEEALCCQ